MRLFILAVLTAAPLLGAGGPVEIGEAFEKLYNFNFPAAHAILDRYIAARPAEPLPYAVRASADLFFELDRLGILEEEFFVSDDRIAEKKKLKPDAANRAQFLQAIQDAQSRAQAILAAHPEDRDALFTMCMSQGLATDYMALVEKHQIRSLTSAKTSNRYAQQLLRSDPQYYDAYLSTGITEYLVGSLPFFIRWFVHFDSVQGSKEQGIQNLKLVADRGHYMRPFAKILLGIVYMREKKPQRTEQLLAELTQEYPQNPLLRKELVKVQAMLRQ
jgi:predicted Zn-dependent protease